MLSQIEKEEREIKELMDTVKAREEERDTFQQSLEESKSLSFHFFAPLFCFVLCTPPVCNILKTGANEALEKEIKEKDEKYAQRGENLLSQIEEEERQIKELEMELENSKRTSEGLQAKVEPLENSLEDEKSLGIYYHLSLFSLLFSR